MTPKQLQDARLAEARAHADANAGPRTSNSWAYCFAIEYARLEREGWTPEVDEAQQLFGDILAEYHKGRFTDHAVKCIAIIRAALNKARADGDADLRARLERVEGLLKQWRATGAASTALTTLHQLERILAKRDTGEMSGYANGCP
jgi:hypothetical protein